MDYFRALKYLRPGSQFTLNQKEDQEGKPIFENGEIVYDFDGLIWNDKDKEAPTKEECDAVSQEVEAAATAATDKAAALQRLAEIDAASVSDLREFVIWKFKDDPTLPSGLVDLEAEAQTEKEKLT